ncbi:C-X-C motif chemokine 9 [Gadus morhua]|uniref:C-X-C motif chemokine 9-like n=1 Tax=Gadus morhua TaxID=8049 RepID=A0A8C5ALJ8_GADMO|nr:C-X-C motif chemokine 9-like [Gadus morhua]
MCVGGALLYNNTMCPGERESGDISSSMKCSVQSLCGLAVFSFCCTLISVRETESTYIPGRCVCPVTRNRVQGILKDLKITPKNPSCDRVTVIVVLKNGREVCVNPSAPLGRHLTHCWKRSTKLNRNVRNCLRRKRRRGPQHRPSAQGPGAHNRPPRSPPASS